MPLGAGKNKTVRLVPLMASRCVISWQKVEDKRSRELESGEPESKKGLTSHNKPILVRLRPLLPQHLGGLGKRITQSTRLVLAIE